jgi:hypothetical protein
VGFGGVATIEVFLLGRSSTGVVLARLDREGAGLGRRFYKARKAASERARKGRRCRAFGFGELLLRRIQPVAVARGGATEL